MSASAGTVTADTATAGAATARVETLQRFEREMSVLVRRVRRVVGERARAIHPDLQPTAYHLLARLVTDGPQRAAALVEAFDLDKAAVSRTLQHLLDLGLVTRTPDPADGRATLVAATADAATRLREVARGRLEALDARLSGWSDDELVAFVDTFARYNAVLEGSG